MAKHNFIFPGFIARKMKEVNQTTPLIVNAVSLFLLLIGFTITMIYRTFAFNNGFLVEGFVLLNLCAGFIFLSSSILTNLQQYKSSKDFEKEYERR